MRLEQRDRVKLDEKDKKILEQLQLNARQSIAEIAKKTKLPRDVVVYRIKKLETSKVIRAHHTMLDPIALGHPLYVFVYFSCYNIKPEEEMRFINYLKGLSKVIYVAKCSGGYDLNIGVCARDYKEYDEVIREIRQKFTDVIKDIVQMPIIQEYKYDWMVDLI